MAQWAMGVSRQSSQPASKQAHKHAGKQASKQLAASCLCCIRMTHPQRTTCADFCQGPPSRALTWSRPPERSSFVLLCHSAIHVTARRFSRSFSRRTPHVMRAWGARGVLAGDAIVCAALGSSRCCTAPTALLRLHPVPVPSTAMLIVQRTVRQPPHTLCARAGCAIR